MTEELYAYWRTDKPKEEGYSPELISVQYQDYKDITSLDEMECWTDRSFDTIYKGLMRLNRMMPDHPLLGHKVVKFGPDGKRLPEY